MRDGVEDLFDNLTGGEDTENDGDDDSEGPLITDGTLASLLVDGMNCSDMVRVPVSSTLRLLWPQNLDDIWVFTLVLPKTWMHLQTIVLSGLMADFWLCMQKCNSVGTDM